MSKRFTETAKWVDPWFRKLTAAQKLLWQYLCDNCDQAGVIDLDLELAAFQIGAKLTPADVEAMGDRVANVRGKLWVRGFVRFQYGKLSEDCKPHAPAIASLQRHGITLAQAEGIESLSNTLSIPTMVGFESLQDKDKEKDKEEEKDKAKETETDPMKARAAALFRRRETTPWGAAEIKAWKSNVAAIAATHEDDWKALEAFYAFRDTDRHTVYRRRDLATLLNNWTGEIDKARDFAANGPALKKGAPFIANEAQTRAEAANFAKSYPNAQF